MQDHAAAALANPRLAQPTDICYVLFFVTDLLFDRSNTMSRQSMTQRKSLRFQDAAGESDKRVRTRALLMYCAIAEFASRGINKTSIDDISAKAQVSHGTFYYHFKNKSEIVEAVGRTVAAGLVEIVDQRIRGVTSGPERVALATQVFIDMASAIPNWGWLVVDALANMGSFHTYISRGIRRDVLLGMRSGDFSGAPSELLFKSLLAVVGTATRVRLETPDDTTTCNRAAELILLMLGAPADIAHTLPAEVIRKYHAGGLGSVDTVLHDMESIMPLILREILMSDEAPGDQ